MACLLYSWFLCYLRVSDCLYAAGGNGLSLYLPLMAGQLSQLALPFTLGGYVRRFCLLKFSPPVVYFYSPAATGDADCRRSVWNVRHFEWNSSVAVAWYLLAIAIAFVEVLRVMSLLEITGGAVGIFGIPTVPNTNPVFVDYIPYFMISMFSFIALKRFALGEPSRQFVNWLQMRWALSHLL